MFVSSGTRIGRGDDTVEKPHRAHLFKVEPFELILLLNLTKRFSIDQFEPTVSTVSPPPPPEIGLPLLSRIMLCSVALSA